MVILKDMSPEGRYEVLDLLVRFYKDRNCFDEDGLENISRKVTEQDYQDMDEAIKKVALLDIPHPAATLTPAAAS